MQLKRKKSLFLIMSIPIIMLLASLTINKQQFEVIKEDAKQEIMSMNLGFSRLRNLLDKGDGGQEIVSFGTVTTSVLNSIPKIIKYKLFNGGKFDRIDININFSNYSIIMKDRMRALQDTVMSNPTEVNAVLEYKGKKYKATVRLKGDLADHWLSKNRHSLRIKIKKDKNILGFSKFSIHKPRARQHPYDYIFQSMIRDTGNLASNHKFAHIFVNGDDWGIMDIEEHISTEFLEKQNRKKSIVVRFSNEDKWLYTHASKNPYDGYRLSDSSLFLRLYNTKSLKDVQNRKIYSYISNNRLSNNTSMYDISSFSKALIMSLVWNNTHTLADENSRYYFNPYTLKLEPITTDQGEWNKLQDNVSPSIRGNYARILSNQHFLDSLSMNLEKVRKTVSNINKHLSYPQSLFPVDEKRNTEIIRNNMKKILNNKEKYLISPIMAHSVKNKSNDKSAVVKNLIPPTKQQASEFKKHLYIKHYTNGNLELYNLLTDDIVVRDISFNGKSFTDKEIIVPSYLSSPNSVIIKTQYKGIQDNMFTVTTRYQNFDRTVNNEITLISDGIKNPLSLNTAHEFAFINKLDDKTYEIKQGNWTVDKPIIVEGDLHISPGVNLQFSKDSYLIVKGSLTAISSKENPIILKSVLDSWKGVYVLNAVNKSRLKNVNISNISALEDELLKLTGGVTFYKSDVDFENVRINDVKAEDAINIVESSFSLNSVIINNTISDGLDTDFSKGNVLNSDFSNIGGDALDFSGSYISINQTKVTSVKDKAISAGEGSTVNIKNSNFKNIGVGVASKDGSSVTMSNSVISNYELHAAMSYIKKDFYNTMTDININNSSISDGSAYLRQKGTNMIVNNVDIPESEVNIKKLYKTNVMAK
jgi:hypothetical protein